MNFLPFKVGIKKETVMKKIFFLLIAIFSIAINAQTNPAITKFLQNTTGITGRH